ncbi:lytic transglycosylase domain-containing protein [Vallicoccus soli]|uniref:Lytic transglycosylase domain-containing protein n=2 Tax=Vallicoccus soli TaxID=2339232 RepID=A0A3A3ZFK2_9ACTN|nr:lytic transglycosylase domain-containing protein [Vallicoccus soli]
MGGGPLGQYAGALASRGDLLQRLAYVQRVVAADRALLLARQGDARRAERAAGAAARRADAVRSRADDVRARREALDALVAGARARHDALVAEAARLAEQQRAAEATASAAAAAEAAAAAAARARALAAARGAASAARRAEVAAARTEGARAAQAEGRGVPAEYAVLYHRSAATCPGMPWAVLAAVGQVESDHGANAVDSSAGAQGPMQFMPATFARYGVDGDGDGDTDVHDPADAVASAAAYLCATGAGDPATLERALWHYNHAQWYVDLVLGVARDLDPALAPEVPRA